MVSSGQQAVKLVGDRTTLRDNIYRTGLAIRRECSRIPAAEHCLTSHACPPLNLAPRSTNLGMGQIKRFLHCTAGNGTLQMLAPQSIKLSHVKLSLQYPRAESQEKLKLASSCTSTWTARNIKKRFLLQIITSPSVDPRVRR